MATPADNVYCYLLFDTETVFSVFYANRCKNIHIYIYSCALLTQIYGQRSWIYSYIQFEGAKFSGDILCMTKHVYIW